MEREIDELAARVTSRGREREDLRVFDSSRETWSNFFKKKLNK